MIETTSLPIWVIAFLVMYFLVALALFSYGIHAYIMAYLFRRVRSTTTVTPEITDWPQVTIQLPIFNERYVATRLIKAVHAMDYPKDKLEIQVLDDSLDDTPHHVKQCLEELGESGPRIVHIQRTDRTGFKAGALEAGLQVARGEFVAVFDADFIPQPSFLKDTVPHFNDPHIGMVQTRWSHLNESYSFLTKAQALALDGHFVVEQTVRNRCHGFMNFNGTAGIWRKCCIHEAGGWQHDTLTEDLDLSYRAQLSGWKFLFLPGVESPAELPAEINGFKGQQFRWAKGSIQTAIKLMPEILRTSQNSFQRFEAFVHLTNHAVYPLLLLLGLMALPALWMLDRYPQLETTFALATVMIVATFGHPWMYAISRKAMGRSVGNTLALVPLVLAGGMGIAINNTRAVLEGVFGKESPFIRTPKYALLNKEDQWSGKKYRAPISLWSFAEVGYGLYTLAAMVYAVRHEHYLILPFLLLYTVGALHIGGFSMVQGLSRRTASHLPKVAFESD